MIKLSIPQSSSQPVYRQIYDEIAAQILSGNIPAGTPLPPIRTVSKELGVSVITVRSAWEALEADGLIQTRVGSGCFVSKLSGSDIALRRENVLRPQIEALIDSAQRMGVSKNELIELIDHIS